MNQRLRHIFLNNMPLLDVRAPIEFAKGAFPSAQNLPILNDQEREQVGICYKQQGAKAAIALGHELVHGATKQVRLMGWIKVIQAQEEAYLYCFRGGLRSSLAQAWLQAEGISICRIEGGYKAMRQTLLEVLQTLPHITIIAGRTGVGKTALVTQRSDTINLEGLAQHRGSAFGGRFCPQPTQINFENELAIHFLKQAMWLNPSVILEDEGRMIGRINLPMPLQQAMAKAPILVLEDSLENRIQRIKQEYIHQQLAELQQVASDLALKQLQENLNSALLAIHKRLGGERYKKIKDKLDYAFSQHDVGELGFHDDWIKDLLTQYYDPMYDYQLDKKVTRIKVQGHAEELMGYLDQSNHSPLGSGHNNKLTMGKYLDRQS